MLHRGALPGNRIPLLHRAHGARFREGTLGQIRCVPEQSDFAWQLARVQNRCEAPRYWIPDEGVAITVGVIWVDERVPGRR